MIFILVLSILILIVCFQYWFWAIHNPHIFMWGGTNIKESKPEILDLYAWKIFRVNQDLPSTDLYLSGLMQAQAKYSLFGENHYRDPQIIPKDSSLLPSHLTILDPETKRITQAGFYCFKKYEDAVEEILFEQYYYRKEESKSQSYFYGGPQTRLIIGKVRIWGTVIEAKRGYQSEYLEIIELYSPSPYIMLREAHWEDDIEWAPNIRFVKHTLKELTEMLGWPFEPIEYKM